MSDTGRFAAEIKEMFSSYGFPDGFLNDFDQLECLAHHQHRETYLVRKREGGELCIAKCYDRADYDFAAAIARAMADLAE